MNAKDFIELYQVRLESVAKKEEPLPPGVIMHIRGKFLHADKVTSNGNLYPRKIVEREVANLKKKIQERAVAGLADHPESLPDGRVKSPSLLRTAVIPTDVSVLPTGEGVFEGDVPDTTVGKDVAALIRAGLTLGVSTRGRGTSRTAKMTEDLPEADQNREWIGRDVNFINEDFELKSFDLVLDQAVGDASVMDFREEKENAMEGFDLKKMTEEQWKAVIESDRVKQAIEAAVKQASDALEAKFVEDVKGQVAEFIRGPEFVSMFETSEGDGREIEEAGKPKGAAAAGKCQYCGAEVSEGMKFCPACGESLTEDANSARDAEISALKAQVEKLTAERDEALRDAAVDAVVEEALKGKPFVVAQFVRDRVGSLNLTEQQAPAAVKEILESAEKFLRDVGADPSKLPPGKGMVEPRDSDAADKGKNSGEITEQDKAEAMVLRSIG